MRVYFQTSLGKHDASNKENINIPLSKQTLNIYLFIDEASSVIKTEEKEPGNENVFPQISA